MEPLFLSLQWKIVFVRRRSFARNFQILLLVQAVIIAPLFPPLKIQENKYLFQWFVLTTHAPYDPLYDHIQKQFSLYTDFSDALPHHRLFANEQEYPPIHMSQEYSLNLHSLIRTLLDQAT